MKYLFKKIVIAIIELQAKLVLKKHKPYVVAITGSVGKTSSKEAVYLVVSSKHHSRKSQKSFNSEIGVPLTILGCPTGWSNPFIWLKNIFKGFMVILFTRKYPKYLVLEVGADRPGDIKRICSWLFPNTGIVTAIGETPVHVEFFPSRDELISEKSELIKALPSDGKAILNADDPDVTNMRALVEGRPIFYGFSEEAEIKASHYNYVYDKKGNVTGFSFKVNYNGSSVPFMFEGFLGRQHVYAILAGISAGISVGMNMVEIQESLKDYSAQPGRVRLLKGQNNSVLIDDSYNASPASVEAALNELEKINSKGRKIAILGDMLDLGKYTYEEHKKVGEKAFEVCDLVISVGARGRTITEEYASKGKHFSDSAKASREFPLELAEGDLVLIKGSQGSRMERITEVLLENKEEAKDKLVRQEEHWKNN
ncbi:MAG: UDP-N-acetylmuramoyl-tripeptide--D-alanyl-D-alanine ligase [Candidatus Paceibacterota bacterium]